MARLTRRLVVGGSLAAPFVARAQPSDWPKGAIRVVVPFPPGGTTDPVARILAAKVADNTGWNMVIDNKPGAAGAIELVSGKTLPPKAHSSVPAGERLRVSQELVDRLEVECDEVNAELEPLKSFVLPGGTELAARLFLARAVCRRAERAVLRVEEASPLVAVYLNRLSDLLFVLARAANADAGEILWGPGASMHP